VNAVHVNHIVENIHSSVRVGHHGGFPRKIPIPIKRLGVYISLNIDTGVGNTDADRSQRLEYSPTVA
jgi:hypothetical protein